MDAWACREGTPEDDEDAKNDLSENDSGGTLPAHSSDAAAETCSDLQPIQKSAPDNHEAHSGFERDLTQEWVELGIRAHTDEELGPSIGTSQNRDKLFPR